MAAYKTNLPSTLSYHAPPYQAAACIDSLLIVIIMIIIIVVVVVVVCGAIGTGSTKHHQRQSV